MIEHSFLDDELERNNLELHPNLAREFGYCYDKEYALCLGAIGLVYRLAPLDSLHNLLVKGNLTWHQRVKAALGVASLLEHMHSQNPPCLIRNISAAHIMIDRDGNPILFDLSMVSGGIFCDKRDLVNQYNDGCVGYVDPVTARPGAWSDKSDVFSYGILLLGIISNRRLRVGHPRRFGGEFGVGRVPMGSDLLVASGT
ncbi:hypothetical protein Tsubulata_047973, partial [Turnera subulata]